MADIPFQPSQRVEIDATFFPCVGVLVRAVEAQGRPAVLFDFVLESGRQLPSICYFVADGDPTRLGQLVAAAASAAVAATQAESS